jgi:hypothetical protein
LRRDGVEMWEMGSRMQVYAPLGGTDFDRRGRRNLLYR